jgi:hypothetical protein
MSPEMGATRKSARHGVLLQHCDSRRFARHCDPAAVQLAHQRGIDLRERAGEKVRLLLVVPFDDHTVAGFHRGLQHGDRIVGGERAAAPIVKARYVILPSRPAAVRKDCTQTFAASAGSKRA